MSPPPNYTRTATIDVTVDGLTERQFILEDVDTGKIIGRVGIAAAGRTVGSIRQLYVVPSRRFEGKAAYLLACCFAFAEESGCKAVNIALSPENKALAGRLYEPLGFRIAAEYSDGERCYARPIP